MPCYADLASGEVWSVGRGEWRPDDRRTRRGGGRSSARHHNNQSACREQQPLATAGTHANTKNSRRTTRLHHCESCTRPSGEERRSGRQEEPRPLITPIRCRRTALPPHHHHNHIECGSLVVSRHVAAQGLQLVPHHPPTACTQQPVTRRQWRWWCQTSRRTGSRHGCTRICTQCRSHWYCHSGTATATAMQMQVEVELA